MDLLPGGKGLRGKGIQELGLQQGWEVLCAGVVDILGQSWELAS